MWDIFTCFGKKGDLFSNNRAAYRYMYFMRQEKMLFQILRIVLNKYEMLNSKFFLIYSIYDYYFSIRINRLLDF